MPLTTLQQQIVTRVRSKTSSNVTELSDDQILYFAGQGATDTSYTDNIVVGVLDTAGVIADVWEWLARADRYLAESEGSVSVSQPVALKMAAYWRGLSAGGGSGGVGLNMTQTERLDILMALNGLEFGV